MPRAIFSQALELSSLSRGAFFLNFFISCIFFLFAHRTQRQSFVPRLRGSFVFFLYNRKMKKKLLIENKLDVTFRSFLFSYFVGISFFLENFFASHFCQRDVDTFSYTNAFFASSMNLLHNFFFLRNIPPLPPRFNDP